MTCTAFLLSSLIVVALFGKVAALDFTINPDPTVVANFSLAIPTLTATYTTVTDDGTDYTESFTTVDSGDACTGITFADIAQNTAIDSSGTQTVVTVAEFTDVETSEVGGEIKYCHKLTATDVVGSTMFVRDTIVTIAIDISGVNITVTGLSTTTAVTVSSTAGAVVSGTTTAVATPNSVEAGTTFTLTIANSAPTIDVQTVESLVITPSGGSAENWIEAGGTVGAAFTSYLATPVCDTASCILLFQLPYSYFASGGAITITGTVNLVTNTNRRLRGDGAATATEASFEGQVGLIAAPGGASGESSASMKAIGAALVVAHAVMLLAT